MCEASCCSSSPLSIASMLCFLSFYHSLLSLLLLLLLLLLLWSLLLHASDADCATSMYVCVYIQCYLYQGHPHIPTTHILQAGLMIPVVWFCYSLVFFLFPFIPLLPPPQRCSPPYYCYCPSSTTIATATTTTTIAVRLAITITKSYAGPFGVAAVEHCGKTPSYYFCCILYYYFLYYVAGCL